MRKVSEALLRRLPKVDIHDHLDGGLRPKTIHDLAAQQGIKLPHDTLEDLANWFSNLHPPSLPTYLQKFAVPCSIMQDEASIERVAYEYMEDMKKDGVIYSEPKFGPSLHTIKGLTFTQIGNAMIRGLERGKRDFGGDYGAIVCGLKHEDPKVALEVAKMAVEFKGRGIAGFDLAGPEEGFPCSLHLEAIRYAQKYGVNVTLHAGEVCPPESIHDAVHKCGTERIGHGIRILDDCKVANGKVTEMGKLAQYVHDKQIPLENCVTSNVSTAAVPSLEQHPFGPLYHAGFNVTINVDGRLMNHTTLDKEHMKVTELFNLDINDIEKITLRGMKAAFAPDALKAKLTKQIKDEFAKAKKELAATKI